MYLQCTNYYPKEIHVASRTKVHPKVVMERRPHNDAFCDCVCLVLLQCCFPAAVQEDDLFTFFSRSIRWFGLVDRAKQKTRGLYCTWCSGARSCSLKLWKSHRLVSDGRYWTLLSCCWYDTRGWYIHTKAYSLPFFLFSSHIDRGLRSTWVASFLLTLHITCHQVMHVLAW